MSEAGSAVAEQPAAPAVPPEDPYAGGDEDGDIVAAALKELHSGGDDSDPSSKPPADDGEAGAEEAEKKPEPASLDQRKEQLKKVLEGLTPQERDQLLGTTDDAFAALTAKFRRNREEREELNVTRAAIERERAEHSELVKEFDSALELGRKNPIEWLKLAGWSLEQAHEYAAGEHQVPIDKRLADMEASYEKRLRELQEAREKDERSGEDAVARRQIEDWHGAVWRDVNEVDASSMPMVSKWDKQEVFEAVIGLQQMVATDLAKAKSLAQAGFRLQRLPNGRPFLATAEAMRYVEARLRKQRETFLERYQESTPSGQGPQRTANPEAGRGPTNLGSSDTAERSLPIPDDDVEDEEEIIKRALAAMRSG